MSCTTRHMAWVLVAALAAVLAGCGGGSGPTGGGIGGTGLHIGPNEGDGAVQVDGINFDTSSATVTISGQPATEADVQRGMVVVVTGTVNGSSGVASAVDVEEVVEGALEAKLDATTMVVLGQTVHVDDNTVFEPAITPPSLDGVLVGELLKIYGFVQRAGVILATRVEREATLPEFQARGIVAALDLGAQTFTLGGRTVDFSGADSSGLPGGVPANGQFVLVKGLNALSTLGELIATRIKLLNFIELDDVLEAEIEGFITRIAGPNDFAVGGHAVSVNAGTKYEGGTAQDIILGARVEVLGTRVNDVLIAKRVSFQASVKLESDVATVSGNSITLVGLPGITIAVVAATEFDGAATGIGDIEAGDHIEIRATKKSATGVIAARIVETAAKPDVILQGPVDATPAPSDPTFSILGVVVDTSGLGVEDFEGANDEVIGRTNFFAEVLAGVLVKAKGDLVGGVVDWDEVEFEGEDD